MLYCPGIQFPFGSTGSRLGEVKLAERKVRTPVVSQDTTIKDVVNGNRVYMDH